MEQIQKSIAAYNNILNDIRTRKATWANTTFPLLKTTLKTIAESTVDLMFQYHDPSGNSGSALITFKDIPSGYSSREGNTITNYTKVGGYLVFGLSGTGKVFAYIVYPYVEEIGTQPEPVKWKNNIEPSSIDERSIYKLVKDFIELIATYELTGDDNVIPYDFGKN
jgi:hypothetical protein